jgi:hypothetical protein
MIKFIPVPISDHDAILGASFNKKFANEMASYYAPFQLKNRDIQVAKETWEYAVTDSILNAIWAGAGKNVIDVSTPIADLDVKGISISDFQKKKYTTEASFLQNNKKENTGTFSKLFETSYYKELKEMFVDPILTKNVGTNNLHLFFVIREIKTRKVFYTMFKVIPNSLTDEEFIKQMTPDAKTGVLIPMIDTKYGKTYVYSSKRRLEVRLNCKGLADFLVYSHTY